MGDTVNCFWVVMNSSLPTSISVTHTNFDLAKKEAVRLSRKTGDKFIVMKSVLEVEVKDIITREHVDWDDIPF